MANMAQVGEHPNIIDLLEVLELIQDSKTTLFLVIELINGGELFDRMKAGLHNNSEDFARRYFTQLISGLHYCHKKGTVSLQTLSATIFVLRYVCLRGCSSRSQAGEPFTE
jgi:serine/threonine protein kinase